MFRDFKLPRTFKEITGDRPRQPASENKLMLSREVPMARGQYSRNFGK